MKKKLGGRTFSKIPNNLLVIYLLFNIKHFHYSYFKYYEIQSKTVISFAISSPEKPPLRLWSKVYNPTTWCFSEAFKMKYMIEL